MRFARAIFVFALVAGLAAYSLDCFAAPTPDDAMQCCNNMPCPQHSAGASQDCCQNMASLHPPFAQAHAPEITVHATTALAILPAVYELGNEFSSISVAAQSHAPPLAPESAAQPLRI